MGQSSRSTGKPCTPGGGLKAKAPRLWEDGNKGTQRTRKLSTGGLPWSWRNGNRRFMVLPWRSTKGVKPDALKGASPVLNGGDEETGLGRPRLVATQLECGFFWIKPVTLHALLILAHFW
jgi:hypothetical protein